MRTNLKHAVRLNEYWVKIRLPNGEDRSPKKPMLFSHPMDAINYAFELHGHCKVSVRPA